MRPVSRPICPTAFLLLLPLLAASLRAQHVLLAYDSGKMALVRAASGTDPCVDRDGKVVQIHSRTFALREVPEYLPVYISVRDPSARTNYLAINGTGQVNNSFTFKANLESDHALEDVFLVLYLETELGGKILFLSEVGSLRAGEARPVLLTVPLDSPFGAGSYALHIFSGGAEVLHSELSFGEREAALDRMVASRVKNVHAASPRFFMGPAPEYPPALRSANVSGQALVSIRIGVNGAVFDPVVKSATDPAFGEAALAAVRATRFLPWIKDGAPAESRVDVPFIFQPPRHG